MSPGVSLQHDPGRLPLRDFVDLAWSENPAQAQHKPRLVVFHGLEGSLNSPYAHGLVEAA
ncbi:hypothetical protein IBK38_27900, partial [Escherichia coli]|nr:hypothetical protein [Escherichia coli]